MLVYQTNIFIYFSYFYLLLLLALVWNTIIIDIILWWLISRSSWIIIVRFIIIAIKVWYLHICFLFLLLLYSKILLYLLQSFILYFIKVTLFNFRVFEIIKTWTWGAIGSCCFFSIFRDYIHINIIPRRLV
jgi:hypothetical protein